MSHPRPEIKIDYADIFEAALATWTDGVLLVDSDGSLKILNSAAQAALGPKARVGANLVQTELGEVYSAAILSGAPLPSRIQLQGRGYSCQRMPVPGSAQGLMLILHPLSNQDEHLQQTARFLDSIVENIPDMIFVKDAQELRFQRFNKAGERLLGIPQEDLIGRNDFDFFPPEQANFFVARDRLTLAGKTVLDIPEEPLETRNGTRWLHTKKIPILDDDGEPIYLLGISADITAQKQAEDALVRINEELERRVEETVATLRQTQEQLLQSQKMEALGRLAGGVAHDFNNLLTVISGYGELLLQHPEASDELQKHIEQILQAAQRATDLTRQMLAFSRQQFLQPRALCLNDRVKGIHKLLSRIIGEDISLSVDLDLQARRIMADPSQVDQVIMNLVVNARDAMPQGGKLCLETRNLDLNGDHAMQYPDLQPGPYVMLSISDTGYGMDPETLKRVFEPFFTTKAKGEGTGLGLATAYGIIKQSMGHIQVESERDGGTVFKVLLPAASAVPLEEEPVRSGPIPSRACESILLVEDEDEVRKLLVTVLTHAGYRVLTACDGASALELVGDCPQSIDLLLTDLVMPGMSGQALAETLLQLQPRLRVVYMSGYSDDSLTTQTGEVGSFIHKPFRPDDLLVLLRQVLQSPLD